MSLFANTGVQVFYFRIERGNLAEQAPLGWHHCQLRRNGQVEKLRYVQWRWEDDPSRLFLAVDTTCGDLTEGHFADERTLANPLEVRLDGLLDASGLELLPTGRMLGGDGRPVEGPLGFTVRGRGNGNPRDVHLAIDFGNSRTGALLVELVGGIDQSIHMHPFDLVNRDRLDAWDEAGGLVKRPESRWFTSQTHWSTPPYLRPEVVKIIERRTVTKTNWLGQRKDEIEEWVKEIIPNLFDDLSMVRMGKEAIQVTSAIRGKYRPYTGVSSPKRYLWAADDHWLQGVDWHMADPYDRHNRDKAHVAPLQGPLLRYFDQSDGDRILDPAWDPLDHSAYFEEQPPRPNYAPRSLMTGALYELISQAYTLMNSIPYREGMGDPGLLRRLASLSLSFPSGMIAPERERFLTQAQKAARIFDLSLGKAQERSEGVRATLGVDEASAVHLTYIRSELRLIDNLPDLWFEVVGRRRVAAAPAVGTKPGPRGVEPGPEVRIACIDIGGGTTDLMIARYIYTYGQTVTTINGETLHRDGISEAGDQLIKRLLERIIVPEFGRAIGLDSGQVQLLFGPEMPANLGFRAQRVDWINRLFVPLAVAYLQHATIGSVEPIAFNDSRFVSLEVLESLQARIDQIAGVGNFNVIRNEAQLCYDAEAFRKIVGLVFEPLLDDFCGRIVRHDVDIVLLAGQPTKLGPIQEMVRSRLPLPPSRIIPMHNYYAGHLYPYQDETGLEPGRIVDPKSAVVVGTAYHFLAGRGTLGNLRFDLKDPQRTQSYHWGILNDANFKIQKKQVLFESRPDHAAEEYEFSIEIERMMIGRRLSPSPSAMPSPVYMLRVTGEGDGPIQVNVRLARYIDEASKEELLKLVSAQGRVRGRDAVAGRNVRLDLVTLAHERYYLDSGGLDNIAPL